MDLFSLPSYAFGVVALFLCIRLLLYVLYSCLALLYYLMILRREHLQQTELHWMCNRKELRLTICFLYMIIREFFGKMH
mgnify:CR=1 FL=1